MVHKKAHPEVEQATLVVCIAVCAAVYIGATAMGFACEHLNVCMDISPCEDGNIDRCIESRRDMFTEWFLHIKYSHARKQLHSKHRQLSDAVTALTQAHQQARKSIENASVIPSNVTLNIMRCLVNINMSIGAVQDELFKATQDPDGPLFPDDSQTPAIHELARSLRVEIATATTDLNAAVGLIDAYIKAYAGVVLPSFNSVDSAQAA